MKKKPDKPKPKIVRQISGGYFQASDGTWWILNQQIGWIRVRPEGSPGLRYALAHPLPSAVTHNTKGVK